MKNPNNLLEDVKKCMTDPISDILLNFSLEKSREGYEDRKRQWENGGYRNNPAVKMEDVHIGFKRLDDLWLAATQAYNLCVNLKKEDFNKWVDWYLRSFEVVVYWYRLKTFDEWLHDWLKDALVMATDCPEDWARMVIERGLGEGKYTNTAIHMYIEWKIDNETLKRLWQYEKYQRMEDRDIEKDIEEAKKALLWMEEDNKKDSVTVLTLKM